MTYIDWNGREQEDLEMENMRRDAREEDEKETRHTLGEHIVIIDEQAQQVTISGNMNPLALSFEDVYTLLCILHEHRDALYHAVHASDEPYKEQEEEPICEACGHPISKHPHVDGDLGELLCNNWYQQGHKPYKCYECGVALSFPDTIFFDGLTYCKEHYPSYDRHEQW